MVFIAVSAFGASAAAQDNPIQIGLSVSLTGAFADSIKPTMMADQLWQSQINSRGGLLGRQLKLIHRDNRSNPADGVAIYQNFLQAKMDFIFENSGSFIVQRESTLAEQHQMLFLAPCGFARSLYERGYKYLFYTGPAVSEDLNIGLANLVGTIPAAARPKTVGYVTVENIAFTSTTKGTQKLLDPLRMETVLDVTYPANINDATPLVNNLAQKKPDLVFQTGLVQDTFLFVRALNQQALQFDVTAIGLVAAALPNFLEVVGGAANGMLYASAWEPQVRFSYNEDFVKKYTEMHGVPPTYNAAQSYSRWQIFEQAVTQTKSLDQKVLRDHIATNSFATVVGTIKYNEQGYSVPNDTIVTQFQEGKRVVIWPREQATGELVYKRK
jgi:branched-chain amino acid transport system substrate-binding protein